MKPIIALIAMFIILMNLSYGLTEDGVCSCGIFNEEDTPSESTLLFEHKCMNMTCDEQGEHTCQLLCQSLAKAANGNYSKLCEEVGDLNSVYLSLYTRVCDNMEWRYSNMTSSIPICCYNKTFAECNNNK